MTTSTTEPRGVTPNELATLLRVSINKVLTWIKAGELPAINTASRQGGKPRFVVLPHHLAEWEKTRRPVAPMPRGRRKKRTVEIDYFPDL